MGSLLKIFQDAANTIKDTRVQEKIQYSFTDIYTSAFALFYLQDPSLLEFQRRIQEMIQKNNLSGYCKRRKGTMEDRDRELLTD